MTSFHSQNVGPLRHYNVWVQIGLLCIGVLSIAHSKELAEYLKISRELVEVVSAGLIVQYGLRRRPTGRLPDSADDRAKIKINKTDDPQERA